MNLAWSISTVNYRLNAALEPRTVMFSSDQLPYLVDMSVQLRLFKASVDSVRSSSKQNSHILGEERCEFTPN